MNEMSVDVSVEYFFGLKKGVSAPYLFAIFLIFIESVEHITRFIHLDLIAASIE